MEVNGQLQAPVALPSEKELPVSICQEGCWVGPRAGLQAVANRKSPALAGYRNPVVQPLA